MLRDILYKLTGVSQKLPSEDALKSIQDNSSQLNSSKSIHLNDPKQLEMAEEKEPAINPAL